MTDDIWLDAAYAAFYRRNANEYVVHRAITGVTGKQADQSDFYDQHGDPEIWAQTQMATWDQEQVAWRAGANYSAAFFGALFAGLTTVGALMAIGLDIAQINYEVPEKKVALMPVGHVLSLIVGTAGAVVMIRFGKLADKFWRPRLAGWFAYLLWCGALFGPWVATRQLAWFQQPITTAGWAQIAGIAGLVTLITWSLHLRNQRVWVTAMPNRTWLRRLNWLLLATKKYPTAQAHEVVAQWHAKTQTSKQSLFDRFGAPDDLLAECPEPQGPPTYGVWRWLGMALAAVASLVAMEFYLERFAADGVLIGFFILSYVLMLCDSWGLDVLFIDETDDGEARRAAQNQSPQVYGDRGLDL